MDLKAIEERNFLCLEEAIDRGWAEHDIARILFDEDVPALIARVKELERLLRGAADAWEDNRFPDEITYDLGQLYPDIIAALNPTESDKPSGRGVKA